MEKQYKIFVIGAIIAFLIPFIDDIAYYSEYSEFPSFLEAVKTGTVVWNFIYLVMLAVIIPIRIIPQLRSKLTPKQMLALNFFSGQSFGFVIIRIITFEF